MGHICIQYGIWDIYLNYFGDWLLGCYFLVIGDSDVYFLVIGDWKIYFLVMDILEWYSLAVYIDLLTENHKGDSQNTFIKLTSPKPYTMKQNNTEINPNDPTKLVALSTLEEIHLNYWILIAEIVQRCILILYIAVNIAALAAMYGMLHTEMDKDTHN